MCKQQPEAEPAGKRDFPAPDSVARRPCRDYWLFLPLGAAFAGVFIGGLSDEHSLLNLVTLPVCTSILVDGAARSDAFRLRAASVDGDGLRLEYRDRTRVIPWEHIGHLRIWTGRRGRLSEIGVALRNGAAVIIRDLSDMEGLRRELEARTGLESKRAGGRIAGLTTDRGFGILMYVLAFVAHVYLYVYVSESIYLCAPIAPIPPAACFVPMLLFLASVFVLTGHIPTHWAHPAPPRLWRWLLGKRPILRGILAASLLSYDVLLIVQAGK